MPSGGRGGVSPAWASTKAPVPSVTFAVPGSQQRSPNSDACWSPAAARTGMPADRRRRSRPSRRSAAAARAGCRTGRAARRPSRARRAGTAASGRRCRRRSRGRRRAGAGATRRRRRRRSVLGGVRRGRAPSAASSPGRWRRARARCARARAPRARAARRTRRPCGGPATRSPGGRRARVARSQTTKVSVWLAMPSAARRRPRRPAAPAIASRADAAIASGSCSTSPGAGNEHATGDRRGRRRSRSSASSTTQRVLDVPWSSPRTSRHAARRAALGEHRAVGGERARRRRARPRPRARRRRARARRRPRCRVRSGLQPSAPAISAAAGAAAASPRSGAVRARRVRRSSTSSRCSAPSCVHAWTTSARRWPPPPSSGSASSGCASISARRASSRRGPAPTQRGTSRVTERVPGATASIEVGGHDAVGRVLAARDRREPGRRRLDHVLAADPRRVAARRVGDQRPQAGGHAVDVVARERLGQQRVGLRQQVVDVGAGGDRRVGAVPPRRVGVADQPAALPRDDEQHALLRPREHAGVHRQAVARDEDVDALGRDDAARRAPPASSRSRSVQTPAAPATWRARSSSGSPVSSSTRLDLARAPEAGDPHARGDVRAVGGGRARDGDDHARVVLGGVVELDGADERVRAQRRRDGQRAAPAQVAVARHRPRAADACRRATSPAPRYARSQPRPRSGHRNGTGATRCGRDPRQQQLALAQRLAHEPDVAHLEVAQAAVDELARRARGARPRGRAPRRARRAGRAWRRRAPRPRR